VAGQSWFSASPLVSPNHFHPFLKHARNNLNPLCHSMGQHLPRDPTYLSVQHLSSRNNDNDKQ